MIMHVIFAVNLPNIRSIQTLKNYFFWCLQLNKDFYINNILLMQDQEYIEEEVESIQSIFNDPNGPYMNAPKKVKVLLDELRQGCKLNIMKFDFLKLGLEKKKTGNNFCSHQLYPNQYFYSCQNCFFRFNNLYCLHCFEPSKHIGHKVKAQLGGCGFCDCGRVDRLKQESFCKTHSKYNIEIECVISEEQRKQFLTCFASLIECCLYEGQEEFLDLLIVYFNKLNENSVYYNRLIFELLNTPSKSQKQKYQNIPYLFLFDRDKKKTQYFILHLTGDLTTRINLCKLIILYSDFYKFQNYDKKELFNVTVIEKLIDEQFQFQKLYAYVTPLQSFMKNEFREKFFKKLIYESQNIKEFSVFHPSILTQKIFAFMLEQSLKFFQNSYKKQKQQMLNQQQFKNLQIDKFLFLFTFSKCFAVLIYQNETLTLRQQLIKRGLTHEKIDCVLEFMIEQAHVLVSRQSSQIFSHSIYFIEILLLLRESKKRKQYNLKLWDRILQHLLNSSQNKFIDLVGLFYYHISLIMNVDMEIIIMESIIYLRKPTRIHSENIEKKMENWFKCFLYDRKQISRQQIVQLKNRGVLNFKEAGKILNELCKYSHQQSIFYYHNQNIFKEQFSLTNKGNLGAIKNSHIKFGSNIPIEEGSLSQVLMDEFLSADNIISHFDKTWEDCAQNVKPGYLYLFFLVVYDIFTNGSNKQVRSRLENLRNNQELVNSYSTEPEEISLIRRLLNIEDKKQQMMEEQGEQEGKDKNQSPKKEEHQSGEKHEDKKVKTQEKKKKIAEKFEQKRLKLLENLTSLNHKSLSSEQQTCILCHERSKQGNQLYYLAFIDKSIACGAFYGKNNYCNFSLTTCFHALHFECFIGLDKQDLKFQCPLCHAQRNCILPTFKIYNKKAMKVCRDIMASSFIITHQILDVDSLFMIIFKHLIQSKGLNSVLSVTRYQQKKNLWQRNDSFLQTIMISIYQNLSSQIEKEYLGEIDSLIAEIGKCEKKQFRIVQLLMAQAIKQAIILQDEHLIEKLLLQARSTIEESNFAIINAQITSIVRNEFPLPEMTEQQSKANKVCLSLSLNSLPNDAQELISLYDINKQCDGCQSRAIPQYFCLICGKIVCESCVQKHNSSFHNESYLVINLKNLLIYCTIGATKFQDFVYRNQFEIGYHERFLLKDDKQLNNNYFHLSISRLNKIIQLVL